MTNENAATANNTACPKPTHFETPGLSHTFHNEDDADMTTPEGRLAWFCARFELPPPALAYDPDEPDALLMSDELIGFCGREGLSLDWFFSGHVGGTLAVYRDKHKETDDTKRFQEAIGKLDETEQKMVLGGMKLIAEADADVHDTMTAVKAQIEEYRAVVKG